jgi:triphosphatase
MSEQELKLHVPAASRQAVEHPIKQGQTQQIHLHALYLDTPERELARASRYACAKKDKTGCKR